MMALSPGERNKLIGLLGMLGSDFPGERANAASLATKLIRGRGLTWGDVVLPVVPSRQERSSQQRAPDQGTARADAKFCLRYTQQLPEWEKNFVISMANRPSPTGKQAAKLRQIADGLRVRGFA